MNSKISDDDFLHEKELLLVLVSVTTFVKQPYP